MRCRICCRRYPWPGLECWIAPCGEVEKDARVGPSKLADSSARGKSTAVKVLEEGTCALYEPVIMEVEVPEEHLLAVGSLPEQEGAMVESPSSMAEIGLCRASAGRGHREGLRPCWLFGYRRWASGADLGAACSKLDIWVISLTGDEEAALGMATFLQDWRSSRRFP